MANTRKCFFFPFVMLVAAICMPFYAGAEESVSVKESVEFTLQQHRSLKAIQENRQAVIHERDRAEKGYYPRVDVFGAAGFSAYSDRTTRSLGHGADTNFYPGYRAGVTLTQPIWDGWATRSKVDIAEETLNSMTQRVLDNATTLALDAIIAHINILRTQEIYKLSVNNTKRHQQLLNQVIDRQRTGADSLADVSQARSRYARAQSQEAEAKDAMLAAEIYYFRLTNKQVGQVTLRPVEAPSFPYTQYLDVLRIAAEQNPKVLALIADIKAAEAGKELSKAAFYPVINVEAGPNYTARGIGSKGEDWTRNIDAMVTVRWNIFNSGADRNAVQASNSRILQARQIMLDFEDELKGAVETSWISLETALDQTRLYKEAATYSAETLAHYKEQFLLGQRSILDVLDAESELYNNSVQSITSQSNTVVATYRLVALTGGLLAEMGVPSQELLTPPNSIFTPEQEAFMDDAVLRRRGPAN